MRAVLFAILFSVPMLFPGALNAGDARKLPVNTITGDADRSHETYRGQYVDLSAVADRKDFPELADAMRHQIDIVEKVALSPRVLQFFRTIPIRVDDFACVGNMTPTVSGEPKPISAGACYDRSVPELMRDKHLSALVWDDANKAFTKLDPVTRAEFAHTGTVMVRPTTLLNQRERPVVLHELFHAYHDHVLPGGFGNPAIVFWFKQATDKKLYPADAYLMTNEREFFAVTTSVFLFGRDGSFERTEIKQAQPDYYKYLVWLFGFDPDRGSSVPVASAN